MRSDGTEKVNAESGRDLESHVRTWGMLVTSCFCRMHPMHYARLAVCRGSRLLHCRAVQSISAEKGALLALPASSVSGPGLLRRLHRWAESEAGESLVSSFPEAMSKG